VQDWTHSAVEMVIPEPQGPVELKVHVGSQVSVPVTFEKPVPTIDARTVQGEWLEMDTRGGEEFWIAGVLDVGTTPADQLKIQFGSLAQDVW